MHCSHFSKTKETGCCYEYLVYRELAVLVVLPEMIAIYLLARLIVALYVLRTSILCVAVTDSYGIFKEHVICRRWIVSSIDSRLSAIPCPSCGHFIYPIRISKDCMPSRLEVIMFRSSWYSSYGVAVLHVIRCIWCRCHGRVIRSHYHHALPLPHFVCCTSSTTWKRLSAVLAMMGCGDVNRPSMRYRPRICFMTCYNVYKCHYA